MNTCYKCGGPLGPSFVTANVAPDAASGGTMMNFHPDCAPIVFYGPQIMPAALAYVPKVPSLDLLERMVEIYQGYLSPTDKGLAQHLEAMRLALAEATNYRNYPPFSGPEQD